MPFPRWQGRCARGKASEVPLANVSLGCVVIFRCAELARAGAGGLRPLPRARVCLSKLGARASERPPGPGPSPALRATSLASGRGEADQPLAATDVLSSSVGSTLRMQVRQQLERIARTGEVVVDAARDQRAAVPGLQRGELRRGRASACAGCRDRAGGTGRVPAGGRRRRRAGRSWRCARTARGRCRRPVAGRMSSRSLRASRGRRRRAAIRRARGGRRAGSVRRDRRSVLQRTGTGRRVRLRRLR